MVVAMVVVVREKSLARGPLTKAEKLFRLVSLFLTCRRKGEQQNLCQSSYKLKENYYENGDDDNKDHNDDDDDDNDDGDNDISLLPICIFTL